MAELCKDLWTLESESLDNNPSFEQNSSVHTLASTEHNVQVTKKPILTTQPDMPLLLQPSLSVPPHHITLPFMTLITT